MPRVENGGVSLYYEREGSGETVAFVGGVGHGSWAFGGLHDAVAGPREALTWDLRGTGRSDAPPGPYAVDDLAADLDAVLSNAGVRRAHLVGAGLGGMVALRYAREHDRAVSLVLLHAAASGEAVDEDALRSLRGFDRDSLRAAFSERFLDEGPVEQVRQWRREEDARGDAWDAQAAAMLDFEAGPRYELTLPALVLGGVDDPVVPAAASEDLAGDLPRGRYEAVAGRHLAFFEHAPAVADELLAFLDCVGAGGE